MLYHQFTIIGLFAVGMAFLGLLLMNGSQSGRPVLLSISLSHANTQKETSHPLLTMPARKQEKEVRP